MHTLFLGSTSKSRQMLLTENQIPFQVIGHSADEESVDHTQSFEALVKEIAELKMNHVALPKDAQEGDVLFVLTADSLGCDARGVVHGKPKDKDDAKQKIKALSENSKHTTAFCLDKKLFRNGLWTLEKRIEKSVSATYSFEVPEHWIDRYLEHSWAMIASGAIAVELYGSQFFKTMNGSYSSIVGLPMFELRQALDELGFFS